MAGIKCRYDGTFSWKKTEGNGLTADLLIKNGIKVFTENDFDEQQYSVKLI